MSFDGNSYAYRSFNAMGTRIRFWIDRTAGHKAQVAISVGENFVRDFDRRLSRFRPDSELCMLNADPNPTVEVSTLMVRFVNAAIDAAQLSGGLVDPTLIAAVERAGYAESRVGTAGEPFVDTSPFVPEIKPAAPNPVAAWREIVVDSNARTITRPLGLRLDSGGCGKGVAADMIGSLWRQLLPQGTRFIIDCGGDMRVGQLDSDDAPYEIIVESDPPTPEPLTLELRGGGIATSGIAKRLWRVGDGYAHHLIDPSTGRPAWTGVASATAMAPSALLAETTAKTALLGGAEAARSTLSAYGGAIVEFDGAVELCGCAREETYS